MYRILFFGTLLFNLSVVPAQSQPTILQQTLLPQQSVKATQVEDHMEKATDVGKIRALLKAARAEFNKVDAPDGLASGAPPGTAEYELIRRRLMLRLIVSNYDRLLAELNRGKILHADKSQMDKNILAGIAGTEKPPYSMLLVERVRERLQGAQFKLRQTEIVLESNIAKKSAAEDNLKKLDGQKRALLEKIERESDATKGDVLEWQVLLVELSRKYLFTELAVLQATHENTEAEIAISKKILSSIGSTLEEVSKNSKFLESDLSEIKKRLEDRRVALEKELEKVLSEKESLQRMAEKRISDPDSAGTTSRKMNSDKQRVSVEHRTVSIFERIKLENCDLRAEQLRDQLEYNRFGLLVWELRYSADTKKDTESIERLKEIIPQSLNICEKQMMADSLHLKMVIQKLNELESELAQTVADDKQADLRRIISMYSAREELLLSRIKMLSAVKSSFERMSSHYLEGTQNALSSAKKDIWLKTVKNIWNYELFATEDVYTVDGKEIKGERGVTIAKVVSALALLIVGWIVSSKCTKMFFRHAVKRYDMPEGGAQLARRWLMALIFVILLLTSLHLVRIPLTAFAFLGGAMVIGVGFGIQDLMKNLMSGIMMMAERPFRIGDFIDVDGVRGRVTSVGIRSSTIRNVTGIETLVPNSTFVEKNVTNWTYSTHHVRYSVTVGVAYGSNVETVKERMQYVAALHDDVLKDPEPLVTLDDFGADALVFGLYYWIGLDQEIDPKVISSDLRIMIEKHLSAEGITIAFPQRDIHLDLIKPLQVELVDGSK